MNTLGPISPFFIVDDLMQSVAYYREHLGFELQLSLPEEDPFFAIVGRDGVRILLKEISDTVGPQPNSTRHEWAPWDAYVDVADPDALAAEFAGRKADFREPLGNRDDGLRGFEIRDRDGYVLFFGRPRGVGDSP